MTRPKSQNSEISSGPPVPFGGWGESRLRWAGVPSHYLSARLDDFGDLDIPDVNDHGLYITGPAGRGKTHLGVAIMADAIEKNGIDNQEFTVAWIGVPIFLMQVRASFHRDAERSEEALVFGYYDKTYCYGNDEGTFVPGPGSVDFLVVDDLGAQQQTDWSGQVVYTILSARVNSMLPTVVTSNFKLSEIAKIDPRLASRLGAMSYLKLGDRDRRIRRSG